MGASTASITRTSASATGRPTQAPNAAVGLSRRTSVRDTELTGNASVAPYGLCNSPFTSHSPAVVQSVAGTGAPAHKTRRSVGSVMRLARQCSPIFRHSVGEPKALVTPSCWIACTTFAGSSAAGRRGSISGTTVVMPNAGLNSANTGSSGRSTSPGSMA